MCKGHSETPSKESSEGDVKILCVGLMRTGLQSLHKAFDVLGYTDIYDQDHVVTTYELWDNVINNAEPREKFKEMFRGAEVVMGMPTFCFWEEILELYPKARVILTVREEDGWWQSVQRAKVAMDQDVPGAPLRYGTILRYVETWLVPSYHKFCQVLRFAWATSLGGTALQGAGLSECATRAAYRRHNAYVRSIFADRVLDDGSPQLLVFDVSEGWAPLCQFLKKEIPSQDFPTKEDLKPWPGGQPRPSWYDKVTGFDELFAPDSDFGIRMRSELRRSLAFCGVGLTALLALGASISYFVSDDLPFFMALIYLSLIIVGWSAYGVIHQLVARVPLLMVLPMALKSLLIAGMLHVCFISYGILKEMLVTKDNISSSVLVLSSRLMSIALACAYMLVSERRISLGAPILSMSAFAFTNEASTWAGYEMLKYVSFPLQVMAKSVKMLPNMIMGRIVNGTKYSAYQYAQAVAALVCVAIMHFSSEHEHNSKPSSRGSRSEELDPNYKLLMGILMLALFFVCDAFTSNWQTALYKTYPQMTQTQMMLGGNLLGFVFTSGTLILTWSKITSSLAVAIEDPAICFRIVALGCVSALGQFCIYSAIRILGSLSFTWIMTARQLLSVLISLIFFGHGVNVVKVLCIVTVFGIMSAKQLAQVAPRQAMKKLTRGLSRANLLAYKGKKSD
eukprot:TRINITY_DN459_c0_g1_i15.p1 TRINITY_DN459_c0_g1~~TRINITY_DN459_c0_g1_i15.p1  ORF type:complete len:679 (+),score=105.56 TRINITY_DN459_c0_g1_i15:53-2089(+)